MTCPLSSTTRVRVLLVCAGILLGGVCPASAQFAYLVSEGSMPIQCSARVCRGPELSVVNVATGNTVATIDVASVGQQATSIALGPGARRAYVTRHDWFTTLEGTLTAIDVVDNHVIGDVDVGGDPVDVVVLPDGNRAYVANRGSGTVTVVDLVAWRVMATVGVGGSPAQLAITPDGSAVYVANRGDGTVSRIATSSNLVTATIPVGTNPDGLDVSPDGARVFVANAGQPLLGAPSLSTIDTASGAVTDSIPMGTTEVPPARVAAISSTRAYVEFAVAQGYFAPTDQGVHLVDLTGGALVTAVYVGFPQALALDSARSRLFIVDNGSNSLPASLKALDVGVTSAVDVAAGTRRDWIDLAITPADATCLFEVHPLAALHAAAGGTGSITVPAPAGCAWSLAVSDSSGLVLDGSTSGVGPGSISYALSASSVPRAYRLALPRQTVVIEQTVAAMGLDAVSGGAVQEPFTMTGWAIEQDVTSRYAPFAGFTGVDAVHVWAYPAGGAAPIFVGAAISCCNRQDVAQTYGYKYLGSGFRAPVASLPTGSFMLAAFAHSVRHGTFTNVATQVVRVVAAQAQMVVDMPAAGGEVGLPFRVAGWAVDPPAATTNGPGIDVVHVWAYPSAGGAPLFLGQAAFGGSRPDVGAMFGTPFTRSGFDLLVTALSPGGYSVVVYARSVATGRFDLVQVVPIRVRASAPQMVVDTPTSGASVAGPFTVAGWALDLSATVGAGVDAVHVWAYPAGGSAPLFVGAAGLTSRPDVAAVFGSQFGQAGFRLDNAILPPGTYDLVVFARSTVAGSFNNTRVVRMTAR